MEAVETLAQSAATNAEIAANNSSELLALSSAAKGIAGFAKKHGPRAVAALSGAGVTAGVLNPKVAAVIGAILGAG